jgi:hypothetical protein
VNYFTKMRGRTARVTFGSSEMFTRNMRKTYALSLIDKMPPLPKGRPFPRIAPDQVVKELRERVNDPSTQDQMNTSLCGPAAFFYCVLNYKPELYVQYVIDLLTTGKARIDSLTVEPSLACRAYDPGSKIAAVDWIALASLRDSENTVINYESADQDVPAITRPATLASWLRVVGYQSVRDNTNYYFCKGRKEIDAVIRDISLSLDVCLLVNKNILDVATSKMKSTFCNHWIVASDTPKLNGDQIEISVYTWGQILKIPQHGSLSVREFCLNFYGYVSGMLVEPLPQSLPGYRGP